jgi:glutathione S-transferase
MNYVEVREAKTMPGLRIVLSPGGPGPWSETAKSICYVKKLSYIAVAQEVGGDNPELRQWTSQTSAPAVIWNDERPRNLWNDQLYLFERLAPEPRLIPEHIVDRIVMFGYANEICGENGLGWLRRLMMFNRTLSRTESQGRGRALMGPMIQKYGYDESAALDAPARVARILTSLSERLQYQHQAGSRFLIGDRLSALDIYWAAFAAMMAPLPQEVCPIAPGLRRMYSENGPVVDAALAPVLLEHRDFIYREYLQLPLDF